MKKKATAPPAKAKAALTHQAISFSPHRILAATVTKGRLQQAQVPLPEGTIVNGQIQDMQTVATQLGQLTKQISLSSNGIVLGIPEHQTFVKQVLVGKGFVTEHLQEQVYKEVEQYFDTSRDQIHADWTLLSSDHTEEQLIQLAAIPQQLAEQYIHILRESKLKTVAIEPPSLTLSRITAELIHPCLIIEAETITNIAISSYPNSVDFTSVFELDISDPQFTDDFNQHLDQMIKYYQFKFEKDLQKIYLTGTLSAQCQAAIQSSVPLELLNDQTHSVIYALAEKPVTPPADPQTINLIPVNLQDDYHAATNEKFTARLINISALFLIVLNIVASGFLITVWRKQISLSNQADIAAGGASIAAAAELSQLQNQVQTVNHVGPLRDDYTELYQILLTNISPEIVLTNISMTTSDHILTISGIGQTQDSILGFKQKIEQHPQFTQVRLPLSIFAQQQEIPFTMTITWTSDPQNT